MSNRSIALLMEAQAAIDKALESLREPSTDPAAWFATAIGELGVTEYAGEADNPRILEYLSVCSKENGGNLGEWGATRDETAWCAAFVGWCLERSGLKSTRSAAARSYEDYGVGLLAPIRGCIVVTPRGDGSQRHVAFLDRVDGKDLILLGGNQSNKVCRARKPSKGAIYRWPNV